MQAAAIWQGIHMHTAQIRSLRLGAFLQVHHRSGLGLLPSSNFSSHISLSTVTFAHYPACFSLCLFLLPVGKFEIESKMNDTE